MEQKDALSPLLFNFPLEYAIRNIQEYNVKLKLIGTHQLLVSADDANLLADNVNAIKENIEALIDDSKETGLKANTEKTGHTLMSRDQNAGQNHIITIANRSFENMEKSK
jgi:hypothetical protein